MKSAISKYSLSVFSELFCSDFGIYIVTSSGSRFHLKAKKLSLLRNNRATCNSAREPGFASSKISIIFLIILFSSGVKNLILPHNQKGYQLKIIKSGNFIAEEGRLSIREQRGNIAFFFDGNNALNSEM